MTTWSVIVYNFFSYSLAVPKLVVQNMNTIISSLVHFDLDYFVFETLQRFFNSHSEELTRQLLNNILDLFDWESSIFRWSKWQDGMSYWCILWQRNFSWRTGESVQFLSCRINAIDDPVLASAAQFDVPNWLIALMIRFIKLYQCVCYEWRWIIYVAAIELWVSVIVLDDSIILDIAPWVFLVLWKTKSNKFCLGAKTTYSNLFEGFFLKFFPALLLCKIRKSI